MVVRPRGASSFVDVAIIGSLRCGLARESRERSPARIPLAVGFPANSASSRSTFAGCGGPQEPERPAKVECLRLPLHLRQMPVQPMLRVVAPHCAGAACHPLNTFRIHSQRGVQELLRDDKNRCPKILPIRRLSSASNSSGRLWRFRNGPHRNASDREPASIWWTETPPLSELFGRFRGQEP